jgi:protein-cysteine N-palmitoyltransferase HHAT
MMAAFFALRYAYMRPIVHTSTAVNNLYRRPFYISFSLLMLATLHGTSILKVLLILSLNYALAKATGGTRLSIPVTWLFNGGVLLANKWYEGYAFANLHPGLALLVSHRPALACSPAEVLISFAGRMEWRIPALAC